MKKTGQLRPHRPHCPGAARPRFRGALRGGKKGARTAKARFSRKALPREGGLRAERRHIRPLPPEGFAISPCKPPAQAGKQTAPQAIRMDFSGSASQLFLVGMAGQF